MLKKTLLVILLVTPPLAVAVGMKLTAYPRRFATVLPGKIYRGSFPSGDQIRRLHEDFGIRTVISLTDKTDKTNERDRVNAIEMLNLSQARFPMPGDGRGDFAMLDRAADAINDPANQPVFYHCAAGKQRSNAVLAAYRMKHCGWTLQQALDELKSTYDLDAAGDESELVEHLGKYAKWLENSTGRNITSPGTKN